MNIYNLKKYKNVDKFPFILTSILYFCVPLK